MPVAREKGWICGLWFTQKGRMEKPHKRLRVWQLGMEIVIDAYKLTEIFPSCEKFGLTSQMRRCAVSIPSNISEGAARNTSKEFKNFLHIAQGSLSELDTQMELAFHLNFISRKLQVSSVKTCYYTRENVYVSDIGPNPHPFSESDFNSSYLPAVEILKNGVELA